MKLIQQKKSEFPVFDSIRFKNMLFISGGGGGKEFGLPNQITALSGETLDSLFNKKTKDIMEGLLVSE